VLGQLFVVLVGPWSAPPCEQLLAAAVAFFVTFVRRIHPCLRRLSSYGYLVACTGRPASDCRGRGPWFIVVVMGAGG
jgi:hypothetical protein